MSEYETLSVTQSEGVATVSLDRPDKANALNMRMWDEIGQAFRALDKEESCRVVILEGNGKHFCAGIDLMDFSQVMMSPEKCEARKRDKLRNLILHLQSCLTAIEDCRKPVLAAIQGACVGGGIDMVAACDMRYASSSAYFEIKEIDIGMTADVGTLQRLPYIIPDGIMRELSYTGRRVDSEEAATIGLINRVFADEAALKDGVETLARQIAAKSPLAIRGTKEMIKYTRDHSVADGLNYIATWNAAMLMSADLQEAMAARMQKREPKFKD